MLSNTMTPAAEYRNLAAGLHNRARIEPSTNLKAEWVYLAYCYELMAQQAEKSARIDTSYEPLLRG
jgi:hypothetical protein